MQISIQHKAFQQKPVLGDIQFELKKGETTVLFGPSGCGKTTLIHILAGLDKSYQGSITHADKHMGIVFQEPRLLPWLSVYENITLVSPSNPQKATQLIETMGLEEFALMEASKLSLGMARRVSLARALVLEPEVLLLDEPFASLDQERSAQLRLLLLQMIEQHAIKVLLVTHDPVEAVQLARHILILGGKPSKIQCEIPINLSSAERQDNSTIRQTISSTPELHSFV